MVFKAVHMNSWRQSKVQRCIQREITQPSNLLNLMCRHKLAVYSTGFKEPQYSHFSQLFEGIQQSGVVHKILSKISKLFVKNQFCWTFRSALTLSSESLATDVNTILYNWGSLLWPCMISMPVEIGSHAVPAFKAPIYCIMEYKGLERAGTFM